MQFDAYYNGLFTNRESIKIPLNDRAVFFGDGVYDAAIGRNGKIFLLDDHINRFFDNADAIDIPLNLSKSELKDILIRLAESSQHECYFLYFQLSRYSESRTHAYPKTKKSNLLITVSSQPLPDVEKRLKLTLANDVRHELCHIKTLNLLPSVMAAQKAETLGKDETVFHRAGTVTECSHSNVHIISNGVLITHPLNHHILPGISRKHMLEVCRNLEIPVRERAFSVYELYKADEVIVTSSTKLGVLASEVDYVKYQPNDVSTGTKICKQMLNDFIEATGKNEENC